MGFGSEVEHRDGLGKILLVGDDMRSFLACARSYGRNGFEVHAVPFDWSASALSSKYVKQVHHLPRIGSNVGTWVDAICKLQDEHNYDLIVPCDERALLPLSAMSQDKRSFKLADPGEKAREFLFDKVKTRELASSLDIPVAPGETVDKSSNASLIVAQYGLPLMLKARCSYSEEDLEDRGEVFAVQSVEQLDDELRALLDGDRFLVEGFFSQTGSADGLGVSVAAHNGNVLAAFQHRRITEKPGGGSSSVRVSEDVDPGMLHVVEKLCEATEFNGVGMFEFRQSVETQEWILLEVNARPWGSMPLPLALGIDFPKMLFDVSVGTVGEYQTTYKPGIVGKNLVLTVLHKLQGRGNWALAIMWGVLIETLGHIVNCARGKEVSDSFVTDDLRPALFEFTALARRGVDRILWQRSGKPERRHTVSVKVDHPLVLQDEVQEAQKKTG